MTEGESHGSVTKWGPDKICILSKLKSLISNCNAPSPHIEKYARGMHFIAQVYDSNNNLEVPEVFRQSLPFPLLTFRPKNRK